MTVGSAEEDDGEITGGCGGDGRQQAGHRGNRLLQHRVSAAQWRVHVQTTETLADFLQVL